MLWFKATHDNFLFYSGPFETAICPSPSIKCKSGQCLDKSFWCDGVGQCPDLSDEANCTSVYPRGRTCPGENFQCKNNVIINQLNLYFKFHFVKICIEFLF